MSLDLLAVVEAHFAIGHSVLISHQCGCSRSQPTPTAAPFLTRNQSNQQFASPRSYETRLTHPRYSALESSHLETTIKVNGFGACQSRFATRTRNLI